MGRDGRPGSGAFFTTARRTFIARLPSESAPGRDGPRVNAQINVPSVRLVKEDGSMVGVTTTRDALKMAEEAGLDHVEI
jgi:translation initiation factor IF-3